MKKLLLVLSVVAMASLLFTGCIPTVPVAVTGVTLDQATMTLTAGGATGTLVETVVPADATDKTVTWSSTAEAVATVANGVVTPLTAGTTTITVTTVDGSLTATCEVTVEVTPVAPTITDIPDQVVYWDEDGWTYQVEVTLGTGTTLTYSLIGAPISMSISSTGLITWTTILDLVALDDVTVNVLANDGESDTATFIYEVREPLPAPPIDVTIEYATTHSYDDGTTLYVRGYDVLADCVPVTVTLSEAVEEDIQIRWNDGTRTAIDNVGWVTLTGDDDGMIFTGCLPFDGEWEDCEQICVEVRRYVADPCCPVVDEIIFTDIVTVDGEVPCASFIVTIEDCTQDPCAPEPGASMFWTTLCDEVCDVAPDCCDDDCSGVGDWSFVLDQDEFDCFPPCDEVYSENCEIFGEFECGCLLYADTGEVVHVVDVSIADNVGNTFTDIWTLTFDTDELTTFESDSLGSLPITGDAVNGWEVEVDNNCTWEDCGECFPVEQQG